MCVCGWLGVVAALQIQLGGSPSSFTSSIVSPRAHHQRNLHTAVASLNPSRSKSMQTTDETDDTKNFAHERPKRVALWILPDPLYGSVSDHVHSYKDRCCRPARRYLLRYLFCRGTVRALSCLAASYIYLPTGTEPTRSARRCSRCSRGFLGGLIVMSVASWAQPELGRKAK